MSEVLKSSENLPKGRRGLKPTKGKKRRSLADPKHTPPTHRPRTLRTSKPTTTKPKLSSSFSKDKDKRLVLAVCAKIKEAQTLHQSGLADEARSVFETLITEDELPGAKGKSVYWIARAQMEEAEGRNEDVVNLFETGLTETYGNDWESDNIHQAFSAFVKRLGLSHVDPDAVSRRLDEELKQQQAKRRAEEAEAEAEAAKQAEEEKKEREARLAAMEAAKEAEAQRRASQINARQAKIEKAKQAAAKAKEEEAARAAARKRRVEELAKVRKEKRDKKEEEEKAAKLNKANAKAGAKAKAKDKGKDSPATRIEEARARSRRALALRRKKAVLQLQKAQLLTDKMKLVAKKQQQDDQKHQVVKTKKKQPVPKQQQKQKRTTTTKAATTTAAKTSVSVKKTVPKADSVDKTVVEEDIEDIVKAMDTTEAPSSPSSPSSPTPAAAPAVPTTPLQSPAVRVPVSPATLTPSALRMALSDVPDSSPSPVALPGSPQRVLASPAIRVPQPEANLHDGEEEEEEADVPDTDKSGNTEPTSDDSELGLPLAVSPLSADETADEPQQLSPQASPMASPPGLTVDTAASPAAVTPEPQQDVKPEPTAANDDDGDDEEDPDSPDVVVLDGATVRGIVEADAATSNPFGSYVTLDTVRDTLSVDTAPLSPKRQVKPQPIIACSPVRRSYRFGSPKVVTPVAAATAVAAAAPVVAIASAAPPSPAPAPTMPASPRRSPRFAPRSVVEPPAVPSPAPVAASASASASASAAGAGAGCAPAATVSSVIDVTGHVMPFKPNKALEVRLVKEVPVPRTPIAMTPRAKRTPGFALNSMMACGLPPMSPGPAQAARALGATPMMSRRVAHTSIAEVDSDAEASPGSLDQSPDNFAMQQLLFGDDD